VIPPIRATIPVRSKNDRFFILISSLSAICVLRIRLAWSRETSNDVVSNNVRWRRFCGIVAVKTETDATVLWPGDDGRGRNIFTTRVNSGLSCLSIPPTLDGTVDHQSASGHGTLVHGRA